MNYFYEEEQIPEKVLQNFKKNRYSNNKHININLLKYLTQDLNIVSNCSEISVSLHINRSHNIKL